MNRPLSQETRLTALSRVTTIQETLKGLINDLGFNPDLITCKDLQVVADKLSQVARREKPWSWRYLKQVMRGQIEESTGLVAAVMALGATIDGVPVELANSHAVTVQATGAIKPGSIVFGDSRPCGNPACPVWFVPRVGNQVYHSITCKRAARKLSHAR